MADLKLFLLSPTVVFRARVNMASVTYPVTQLTFDNVTVGAYSDIRAGMTVRLGTSAGLDNLGRTYAHTNGATSSTIAVGMSSEGTRDGELTVDDNAYIEVLNDFRVWAKPPIIESDGEVLKDGVIQYSGQNSNPVPVPLCRPGVAGTVDGSGWLTVQFDASESYAFDFIFDPVASYLWDFDDGGPTVGSTGDAAVTAQFPAGFRWVRLRVGTAGGRYAFRYIPILALPANDTVSITNFQITEHTIRPSGQHISLKIFEDIPRGTYPDGTLMMLWEGEPLTTATSNNMLFIGWHHNDNNAMQSTDRAILRDTTLSFVDVAGKLATLPGFPQLLKYDETPGTWEETDIPSLLFYPHYLLHWHSTALELGGLRPRQTTPSLILYPFSELGSDAGNLYEQVQSLAQKVTPDFHFTCNRQGQLLLVVDPMIQNTSTRTSNTRDVIDDSDWLEIRYPYERPPRVYQLRTYAVVGSTSGPTAIAALAPGTAPGQGERVIETSERYAASQGGLNITEGNRYARLNARYGMFSFTVPYERLTITHDPAYMEWVKVDISADHAAHRGAIPADARGLVHEINIRYDYTEGGLVRTATLQWEMETSGPAAITMDLP